jgi:hypothetical protein
VKEKLQRDVALYDEIYRNLTAEVRKEEDILEQLRQTQVRAGICVWNRFFGVLCDVLGGAVELQDAADDEYLQIHNEWMRLQKVDHRAFLEQKVADLLQERANKNNEMAQELYRTAEQWEQRAHVAAEQATKDKDAADLLFDEAERIEARAKAEATWKEQNKETAAELWKESDHDHRVAYRRALAAILLGIAALFLSAKSLVQNLLTLRESFLETVQDEDVWRKLSLTGQHVLIFLLTTGWLGEAYLLHLDQYNLQQKAVLVVWFAFVAAGAQSMLIHALPHCMAEWPIDSRSTVVVIAKHTALRVTILTALFVMEFLLAWLSLRSVLFAPNHVRFFAKTGFRLICLLSFALHIAIFEPRVSVGNEQSTVLTEDDHSLEATESTPLQGSLGDGDSVPTEGESLTPTESMPLVYLGGVLERLRERRAVHAPDPYHVHVRGDAAMLLLVLDALLIVCCCMVVRNGTTIWWDHPLSSVVTLLCAAALLPFLAYAVLVYTPRLRQPSSSKKVHSYVSLDV